MSDDPIKLVTKYEQIEKLVSDRIESGQLKPGDKVDSEYTLAEQLGVHRFTVNKAISNLVRRGLLYRVQGKGTFVSDEVSARKTRTGSYGVLFSGPMKSLFTVGFYSQILAGIRDSTEKDLLLFGASQGSVTRGPSLDDISWDKVDGLLLLEIFSLDYFEQVRRHGKPFVVVDYEADGMSDERIVLDNVDGGHQLTRHLIELGHTRIAFIGESPDREQTDPAWADRRRGYERALEEAGIEARREYFHGLPSRSSEIAGEAADHFFGLDEPPTAVVCTNDGMCATFIKRGRELGASFPRECSVAGFGDEEIARLFSPALTSVRPDLVQMGRVAVERLAALIENPDAPRRRTVIPVELVARESTTGP